MDIIKIKRLTEQKNYNEALSICNELLAEKSNDKTEIFRARAYIYSLIREYKNELQDRKAILETDEAMLKDYYLAGNSAISSREFKLATSLLEKVIKLGLKQNETWFDSASFFLLAYAQMELGNYEESIKYLNNAVAIDANCSMPLAGLGMMDHIQLRKEIARRLCGLGTSINI